jgi:hypothetical protein
MAAFDESEVPRASVVSAVDMLSVRNESGYAIGSGGVICYRTEDVLRALQAWTCLLDLKICFGSAGVDLLTGLVKICSGFWRCDVLQVLELSGPL